MQIHETAFIISTYRSYHEEVSLDIYAKLWNNPKTEALIPSILESISTKEPLMHSLRNRFFYEQMKTFFSKNKGGTLINFGAGFSMYQFLIDLNVSTIEIDKKDSINYKKEHVDRWIKEEKLPQRGIQYLAIDFNTTTEEQILSLLQPLIKKEPTFIVLEGVLFFLDQNTTDKLFSIFKGLQNAGDIVGSVSYLPELENTEVYKRLLDYFDNHNDTNESFYHQTIAHAYYKNLKGYTLQEYTDDYQLSKIYADKSSITDKTKILNESMYLLRRV